MSDALTRFNSSLIYESEGTADQLLADFEGIKSFDKEAEKTVSRGKKITLFSFLGGVAVVVISLMSEIPALLGGVPLAVVLFIIGIIIWVRGARINVENRRYGLAEELIKLMRRDMPKDGSIKIRLDLNNANAKNKKTGTGEVRTWSVTYFVDPWVQISGRMVDGTWYQIGVVEKYQQRGKWKRSSSGKNKYKTKVKKSTEAIVSLYPKTKKFQNLAQTAGRVREFIQLPKWAMIKKIEGDAEKLTVTTINRVNWDVRSETSPDKASGLQLVAMMLLSLYQVLHASNVDAKAS